MALVECTECGKEVSKSAKVCPHCGKGEPGISDANKIIQFIVGVIIAVVLLEYSGCSQLFK
ncbi:hypothetical protein GCM10027019_07450 [Melaminivora jejuensis]|uniref:zinc ribbon domain-containing protein n=1 Tax=Melaminivora jejuensis TaxID=1267217 RepID=UPI001AE02F7D